MQAPLIVYNHTEYKDLPSELYTKEKYRLQVELLKMQQWMIKEKKKIAIVLEGRDAAGKGSTIRRFIQHMMPKNTRVVELGVPTRKQNRNWFSTYKKHLPRDGQIVFFDRSWYSRAVIQPTMGYCSKSQYYYFINNVNDWEKRLINDGLIIFKFLLVVNIEGLGIDFCSYFENRIDSIFFTDFDVLRTTSSIGLEISNASSLDSISESERVFPSTSIFCSRFSALMSKTTSVLP